jgi:hypothetical protein
MARRKKRVHQHIMEDLSIEIVKNQIPKEWVTREFNKPDYGIDLVIEIFKKINNKASETLGEFIYVQVKSVNKLRTKTKTIYDVENVSKGFWNEDKSKYTDIDIVTYKLDTDSVYTVQALGGSVSVLLFLVDLSASDVYFICLNDYIDKIILPQNSKYADKKYLTINIPVFNKLSNQEIAANALKFYGKRAKFLASFSKFSYQKNEINYLLGLKDSPILTYRDEVENGTTYDFKKIKTQILYFIFQIEKLDIWEHYELPILPKLKERLLEMKKTLQQENVNWNATIDKIIVLWHQLTTVGVMYEDICREWFLPKIISLMTSYPTFPEIVDGNEQTTNQKHRIRTRVKKQI